MTTALPTPEGVTGCAEHDESVGIGHELDDLYPGRWALLLLPLCSPSRPHQHGRSEEHTSELQSLS